MHGYSSNNSVTSTSPRSKFLAMGLSSLETIPKRVRPIVKADEFNFNQPPTILQSNQYKSNNNEYNTNLLQKNQAISNQNKQNNHMYNNTTNTSTIPPEILRHQYTDFQKKIIAEQFSGNYKHQLSSPKRLQALKSGVDYEGCLFSNHQNNCNNSSGIGSNSKYINHIATNNNNTTASTTTTTTTTNNNNNNIITINNNHNNNNSSNTEYLDFHSKMQASLPPPIQQTRKPYNRNLNTPNNNNTQYIGLQIGSYSDNNTIKRKKLESQHEYARLLQDDINIKSVTKKRQECNGRLNLLDDGYSGSGSSSYVGSIGNSNSVVIDGGGEQRRHEAQKLLTLNRQDLLSRLNANLSPEQQQNRYNSQFNHSDEIQKIENSVYKPIGCSVDDNKTHKKVLQQRYLKELLHDQEVKYNIHHNTTTSSNNK